MYRHPQSCSSFFPLTHPSHSVRSSVSLHDALPIARRFNTSQRAAMYLAADGRCAECGRELEPGRSEEHTSELQSRGHLVCALLLEKKNEATRGEIACHVVSDGGTRPYREH